MSRFVSRIVCRLWIFRSVELRAREVVHFQRLGEALERTKESLNANNFYYFNPEFDKQVFRLRQGIQALSGRKHLRLSSVFTQFGIYIGIFPAPLFQKYTFLLK